MIPGSWTTPWLFPLDSNELGLSVRSVHLKDQSDGAVHPMVAVGTAFTIGVFWYLLLNHELKTVPLNHKEIEASLKVLCNPPQLLLLACSLGLVCRTFYFC